MKNEDPKMQYAVTKTYSLSMLHIARISDLAKRLGISQGECVRRAIDLFWEEQEKKEQAKNG